MQSLDTFKRIASMSREGNSWLLRLLVQAYAQEDFLFNFELLLDVDTVDDVAIVVGLIVDVLLAKHVLGHVSDLAQCLNAVDASAEPVFFEIARCASVNFHLGLDHELLGSVVGAKGTSYVKGLLLAESYLAARYGDSVSVHNLGRLVFV